MNRFWRRSPPASRGGGGNDYKAVWNRAATENAVDAILTGASAETFEKSGQGDADRLLPFVDSRSRVLNIGCGIGRVEKYLAPHVAEIWAVDISGEMIARARVRLTAFSNVHLKELALGEFLRSFEDASFDLVFSFLVLQHMEREDAFRYLEDSCRILKPGGRLSVQFPNLLSPEYSEAFRTGASLPHRSAGRVRTYTEPEVRRMLEMLTFDVESIAVSTGKENNAEIYAVAKKRA